MYSSSNPGNPAVASPVPTTATPTEPVGQPSVSQPHEAVQVGVEEEQLLAEMREHIDTAQHILLDLNHCRRDLKRWEVALIMMRIGLLSEENWEGKLDVKEWNDDQQALQKYQQAASALIEQYEKILQLQAQCFAQSGAVPMTKEEQYRRLRVMLGDTFSRCWDLQETLLQFMVHSAIKEPDKALFKSKAGALEKLLQIKPVSIPSLATFAKQPDTELAEAGRHDMVERLHSALKKDLAEQNAKNPDWQIQKDAAAVLEMVAEAATLLAQANPLTEPEKKQKQDQLLALKERLEQLQKQYEIVPPSWSTRLKEYAAMLAIAIGMTLLCICLLIPLFSIPLGITAAKEQGPRATRLKKEEKKAAFGHLASLAHRRFFAPVAPPKPADNQEQKPAESASPPATVSSPKM